MSRFRVRKGSGFWVQGSYMVRGSGLRFTRVYGAGPRALKPVP